LLDVDLLASRAQMGEGCFYEPLSEAGRYRATSATAGPWDPGAQHGGPPAALLATTIEQCEPLDGLRLARITVELLGPIPVGDVLVQARVVRPGRRVRLLEASLEAGGRPRALARAWQIVSQPDLVPPQPAPLPPALPEQGSRQSVAGAYMEGYAASIEWRFVSGGFDVAGPAQVWTRVRIPLIADQPLNGLQRLLTIADSANGVSGELPFTEWLFVPTALTVTLHRHPCGDWTFMRAETSLATDGVGSCQAQLADVDGVVGSASQPLVIARRE
jgi:Thioesterase-like superfamily